MLFAVVLYELLLGDSGRVVTKEALDQIRLRSNRLSDGASLAAYNGEESRRADSDNKEAEIWHG